MGARPILLVDDDIQILKVYKKILQLNGFDVSTGAEIGRASCRERV